MAISQQSRLVLLKQTRVQFPLSVHFIWAGVKSLFKQANCLKTWISVNLGAVHLQWGTFFDVTRPNEAIAPDCPGVKVL